jgi:hypothetical protein
MDREFLRANIPEVHLHTTAASEHVPEIEWQICLVKERTCHQKHPHIQAHPMPYDYRFGELCGNVDERFTTSNRCVKDVQPQNNNYRYHT